MLLGLIETFLSHLPKSFFPPWKLLPCGVLNAHALFHQFQKYDVFHSIKGRRDEMRIDVKEPGVEVSDHLRWDRLLVFIKKYFSRYRPNG